MTDDTYRKWRQAMNDHPRQKEVEAAREQKKAVRKSMEKFSGLEGLRR